MPVEYNFAWIISTNAHFQHRANGWKGAAHLAEIVRVQLLFIRQILESGAAFQVADGLAIGQHKVRFFDDATANHDSPLLIATNILCGEPSLLVSVILHTYTHIEAD